MLARTSRDDSARVSFGSAIGRTIAVPDDVVNWALTASHRHRGSHNLGDAEVEDLQSPGPVAILSNNKVHRLDVTMHDVVLVSVVEAFTELLDQDEAFNV